MRSDQIQPELLMSFIARNGGATAKLTTRDAWRAFIQGQTGMAGTLNDVEDAWLRSKGATGKTTSDLWDSYLNKKMKTGKISDKMRSHMKSGTA